MTYERRHWWHRRPHVYPRPALHRRLWFTARGLVLAPKFWAGLACLGFVATVGSSLTLTLAASHSATSASAEARTARNAAARTVAVQRAEEAARCDQRAESRASIREAIDVAVDVVARYAKLDPGERADLSRKVTAGVYEALPPPTDCVQTTPFASCEAARLVGATPLRRGEAGYSAKLDHDHDGIACE